MSVTGNFTFIVFGFSHFNLIQKVRKELEVLIEEQDIPPFHITQDVKVSTIQLALDLDEGLNFASMQNLVTRVYNKLNVKPVRIEIA